MSTLLHACGEFYTLLIQLTHAALVMIIAVNPFALLSRNAGQSIGARPTVCPASHGIQSMRKGSVISVSNPMNCKIECMAGSLWITHDGDPKDVILEIGRQYLVDRDSHLLIFALDCSAVKMAQAFDVPISRIDFER